MDNCVNVFVCVCVCVCVKEDEGRGEADMQAGKKEVHTSRVNLNFGVFLTDP